MFKNYLKISIRNLLRHRTYSFINVAGLAIGITCCVLILLFVEDEFSYDRYHEKVGQIYRLLTPGPVSSAPMGPALLDDYSQVINFVRFRQYSGLFSYGERRIQEKNGFIADANVFDIFTFPLIKGNPKTALKDPYSIVISERMARKYFEDEDPIGKILTVDQKYDYKITGVLANMPRNSHFMFDYLISFVTANALGINQHKGHFGYFTYLLLSQNSSPDEIEKHSTEFIGKLLGEEITDRIFIRLQPLSRIHLYSRHDYGFTSGGDILFVYLLIVIAFLILLIACINYMNMATARHAERVNEVGIRKVVGAHRLQLIKQFLAESFFLSFIAVLLAVALIELLLPTFNALINRELMVHYGHLNILLGLIGIGIFVGSLSGTYPALFLSAGQPIALFKGSLRFGDRKTLLRKILAVAQFAISIILIICTSIIYNQIHFMKNKNLGFNKEQVVVIPVQDRSFRHNIKTFKNELLQHPNIISATASSAVPGMGVSVDPYYPEGVDMKDCTTIKTISVDYDYVETFGITIAKGRNFSKDLTTDEKESILINEAAAREFGWESPIGKKIQWLSGNMNNYSVIGVVKDFHFQHLGDKILPLVLQIVPDYYQYVVVRIRSDHISETLAFLKSKWHDLAPQYPFNYSFVDDNFDRLYQIEEKIGKISGVFSVLAILIACLGLFGLASFATEQRTKEIGIRKVLGASVPNILLLLSREFVKLVIIANIIAWPIAYLAMNRLLQFYAYHIEPSIGIFILCGMLALVIAQATVSYQALKVALANPVEALRYE